MTSISLPGCPYLLLSLIMTGWQRNTLFFTQDFYFFEKLNHFQLWGASDPDMFSQSKRMSDTRRRQTEKKGNRKQILATRVVPEGLV